MVSAGRLLLTDPKALGKMLKPGSVPLPSVEAPSLDGIVVKVPPPDDITPDDVGYRLIELGRKIASKRDRKAGEVVGIGDEVCLDMLGYANGKLIPFSPRERTWTIANPSPVLPGLFEQLIGQKVGTGLKVEVTLPDDFRLVEWRGAKAVYLIDIQAAREVEVFDYDSQAFVKRLGRGPTVDAMVDSIVKELENERADELITDGINMVVDVLIERSKVELTDEVLDDQIRALWLASEAPILSHKNFTADEQTEAVESWLRDEYTRADAWRRLCASIVIKAIAERDNITATRESMIEVEKLVANALGIKGKALNDVLDWDFSAETQAAAVYILTIGHVMARATLEFEKPPPKAKG
jgi:trigger factor